MTSLNINPLFYLKKETNEIIESSKREISSLPFYTLRPEIWNTASKAPAYLFDAQNTLALQRRFSALSPNVKLVGGKVIAVYDHLYTREESEQLREFTETTPFRQKIFSSPSAHEKGEKPVSSLTIEEHVKLLHQPPPAIETTQAFFAWLGMQLNASASTQPLQVCRQPQHCADAVVTNFVREVSEEGMHLGWHQDYTPQDGIFFDIPRVHGNRENYPRQFTNGAKGLPWLISAILYVCKDNFRPEWGMGTRFFAGPQNPNVRLSCRHMRLVVFEGDLPHTLEASNPLQGEETWRVSYVWKLCFRSTHEEAPSLKDRFLELYI